MSNQLNIWVEEWFQQLEKAARHLPGDEREKLHQELRQHLESLAADKIGAGQRAEEAYILSLGQMGNPGRIGRKVYLVWKQAQGGFRAEVGVVFFVLLINFMLLTFRSFCFGLWTHAHGWQSISGTLYFLISFGIAVVVGFVVGTLFPFQALIASLYGMTLVWALEVIKMISLTPYILGGASEQVKVLIDAAIWTFVWIILAVITAYLASVTKRGWYKPTLADFKLTLPRRWAQAGR